MTWLPQTAPGPTSFARVFGLCPELYADVEAFAALVWTRRALDPVLLELCRLRIAQILGCTAELQRRSAPALAAGLTEERIAALDDWAARAAFSAAEYAGLRLSEKFVLDPFMGFSKIAVVLGQEPEQMPTTVIPTPVRPE